MGTQLVGCLLKGLIPLFAKTADEWSPKKLIYRQLQFATFLDCRLAHIPTVVVETCESVLQLHLAYGIQGATDGLAKLSAPITIGLLEGTKATSVGVAGEHAILDRKSVV